MSNEHHKDHWFSQNWVWFVPVVVALPLLLVGGCCVGGAALFFVRTETHVRSMPTVTPPITVQKQTAPPQVEMDDPAPLEQPTATPAEVRLELIPDQK